MGKINQEQLERLKRIQDADDDDLELDITHRRRLHKPVHKPMHKPMHKPVHESKHDKRNPDDDSDNSDDSGAPEQDEKKDTNKLLVLLGIVTGIFIIFALLVLFTRSVGDDRPLTIEEMHQANLEGKLDPEQGYVYRGFSFVNIGGVWYSAVQKGDTIYDITFNNDPRAVENIPVQGMLSTAFDRGGDVYITFDPSSQSTKYIAVANAGLSLALAKGFQYNLTATCTDPDRSVCQKNGAVSCADKDKAVIYFKEAEEAKILLDDNCVTVQGYGPDLVRAKDRLLMRWYGIME